MNGFFYIDSVTKQQCGPFSLSELESKNISSETMVWHSGMTDWVAAGTVEELAQLFGGQPKASSQINVEENAAQNQATNYNYQQQPQQNINPQNGQYNNNNGNYGGNPYMNNYYNQTEVRPMPKNWLVESILATIFCCWPFGIAGIIAANKVSSLYLMGDYDGSEQASRNAKKWTMVAFFINIVLIVLYILFVVVLGVASSIY